MNLIKVQDFIEQNVIEMNKPQTLSFKLFFDVFKLRQINDPISVCDTEYVNYENCRSRDCPLFCRSGPWSSNRTHLMNNVGIDFEDIIDPNIDPKRLQQSHCTKF